MIVDLDRLEVKSLSGVSKFMSVRETLAELIYERMGGLKFKLLAEKIYKESPCDLSDEEVSILKSFASHENGILSSKMSDAIINTLNRNDGKDS